MPGHTRDAEKEAYWRKVFADFAQSELSAAKFCELREIRYGQFMDWRRMIQARDRESAQSLPNANAYVRRRKAKLKALPAANKRKSSAFAEVQIVDTKEASSDQTVQGSGALELVFPDGLVLRISEACSTDLLHSVVSTLRSI